MKGKAHCKKQAGRKAERKKAKDAGKAENPKAFTFKSAVRAARAVRRNLDREAKRDHLPAVDHTPPEPPPVCVAVVGPGKVGKSTLIRCLVRHYTKQSISDVQGPITVVSGMQDDYSSSMDDCSRVTVVG